MIQEAPVLESRLNYAELARLFIVCDENQKNIFFFVIDVKM